ncbi:hypothetical protein APS_0558 [Acetobacter pasteurianus subsp. pasteurianus LMG 1262 = NBRC 106471]|nr:hypothetical protein APS_0558 [Acetobacter pasteurianus subsp. pasteurianus LMG 1262 = NBRC 106471]CCT60671.1 hypothetical protein APA386B_2637 [Acetobacter pasteurianus 386B]
MSLPHVPASAIGLFTNGIALLVPIVTCGRGGMVDAQA